jgi:uncharacterized protein YmfQ (DUF2313 family)
MTRDINQAMYDYIPGYYEDIREARAIIDSDSDAISELNVTADDVLDQMYVDKATWGLEIWERFVGLPNSANYTVWDTMSRQSVIFNALEFKTWNLIEKSYTASLDERRSAVKARLRGTGTVTKDLLKTVCAAYTGGTVDIVEKTSEFKVQIVFTDLAGVPANMDALEAVLRDIMPAHLEIEYVYRYLRWNELDGYTWSWDTLDGKSYTWDELSTAIQ